MTKPNAESMWENTEKLKNTSVTLAENFEQTSFNSTANSRNSSANEVSKDGQCLLKEKTKMTIIPRETIEAGRKSGFVKLFDPINDLEELNRNFKK